MYCTEMNFTSYSSLKLTFDQFLSKTKSFEFQPFDKQYIFEGFLRENQDSFVIVSDWYFEMMPMDIKQHLQPYLVGVKNKQEAQKKILVTAITTHENLNFDDVVASSGEQGYTKHFLETEMEIESDIVSSLIILTVTKDIDGLLSIGYDAAQGAIVAKSSYDQLKIIDKSLYDDLRILKTSRRTFSIMVIGPKKIEEKHLILIENLTKMQEDIKGEQAIKMINLDKWKRL
jgi:hypothetical protein